ncbi:reverse transcriptase domain-containing protein [Tanacetum coccineum]
MTPKKRTKRSSPATTTTTTTPVTDAQLKTLIAQGVADMLVERDATRSRNGEDNHDSGTGGTEGVVELTQCFERIEIVFRISNCTDCWSAAYGMPWKTLMKMMTDKYCPRNEIKKLEMEIWDLKVKGTNLTSYTQCFQELALLCERMFPEESDKIEKQKIRTLAERQAENKRKLDNNNQTQQQPPKKQGVAIAYTAGSGERKEFAGTLPLCNKCKFHHNGQCTVKCANCKRVSHLTRDCRSLAATNN